MQIQAEVNSLSGREAWSLASFINSQSKWQQGHATTDTSPNPIAENTFQSKIDAQL
jgi:cytochrome c